jgi:hypothetical protein
MMTSKWMRDEALRIFYSQNQFYLEGDIGTQMVDTIKSIQSARLKLIMKLFVEISPIGGLDDVEGVGALFERMHGRFVIETLRIKFVIHGSNCAVDKPLPFCKLVQEKRRGMVEIHLRVQRSRLMHHPQAFVTVSGSDMEKQMADLCA